MEGGGLLLDRRQGGSTITFPGAIGIRAVTAWLSNPLGDERNHSPAAAGIYRVPADYNSCRAAASV